MTSMQSTNTYTDYNFMYDVPDLKANQTLFQFDINTISGFIQNNPEFTIFNYLLDKSQQNVKYGQMNANFTFFIARDEDILKYYNMNDFLNMDLYTARQIVLYSTMPKIINIDSLIRLNDMIQVNSRIDDSFLTIENLNGPIHINGSRINEYKKVQNGIIYVIDKLLVPPSFYQ